MRKWLSKLTGMAVAGFALGWATRGVLASVGAPWWLTAGISLVLLTVAVLIAMPLRSAPKRPPFSAELDAYLRAHDSMLITRELAASKGLLINIVPSDLVPPKMAYFVNGEEIDRIMRNMPAPLFQPVDYRHLPGCRKRNDATAPCICGARGAQLGSAFREQQNKAHADICPSRYTRGTRCICPPKPEGEKGS